MNTVDVEAIHLIQLNEDDDFYFLEMESVFRKYFSIIKSQHIDLQPFSFKESLELSFDFPECYELKKMVTSFISFRLTIILKKIKAFHEAQRVKKGRVVIG